MCASSLPWSGDVAALSRSLVGFLIGWRCVLLQKDPDRAICARTSPFDDQVKGQCDRMKRYDFGLPDQRWSGDIYTYVGEFVVREPRALFDDWLGTSALPCCPSPVVGGGCSYSRPDIGKVGTPQLQTHASLQGHQAWWEGTAAWIGELARLGHDLKQRSETEPQVGKSAGAPLKPSKGSCKKVLVEVVVENQECPYTVGYTGCTSTYGSEEDCTKIIDAGNTFAQLGGKSHIPVFHIRMEKMKEVKRPPL
ncbi:hypothetical protein GW17_00058930 [Ensete ventricosum]|nr:hypothetical protein GW17_00058930 [Ensete ventricosum]